MLREGLVTAGADNGLSKEPAGARDAENDDNKLQLLRNCHSRNRARGSPDPVIAGKRGVWRQAQDSRMFTV